MIIAIIVLSILLVGATAFIFWLLKVLKNTFSITENLIDMAQGKSPRAMKEAYDGKYYPATVITQVKFGCDSEMMVTDFSLYEDKKIVGFIICTTETMREYIGVQGEDIPDDILEETLCKPTIFKYVVVYAPWEGMGSWKSQA